MHSPWDDIPETIEDAVESIADDDAETTPLSAQEESQVWKSRAHQLWETARRDGNTQAQASAITVALRHLAAAEKVAAEKVANETGLDEEVVRKIKVETLDSLVRVTQEHQQKHYTHCHCCHSSWGDAGRVKQFTGWLVEKGLTDDFQQWLAGVAYITNERKEDDHENRAN